MSEFMRPTVKNRQDGLGLRIRKSRARFGYRAGREIGHENTLKVETRDEMPASRRHASTGPAEQVVCRYVTQEIRSTVKDASVAVRPRVQCGTSAGHMSPGSEPEALEQAADLRFLSWGGQDLNLRPTDYESAALTN
jgi:hypothetical protein